MVGGLGGGLGRSVIGQAVIEIVTDSSKANRQITALQRNLAIGTVAAFGAATIAATGFESRMVRIENLVGINRETLRAWQADILGLADATAVGPNELAEALFVVTSAGERGANAMVILENAAKASAIGLGNTAAIARTVTAAMQAWGSETLSAERATRILATTVREGNLEASSLATSLGRVLGIAAQVGVTFEDVGTFIAVFTRLGVSAEEATTALRSILNLMIKPTEAAGEALAGVGLSMEELRRIAVDEGLPEALNRLVAAFAGNEEQLALVIPNVRALSGVLGTAGAQSETFAAVSRGMKDDLLDLDVAMDRVRETTEFQFRRAIANAQVALIQLGSVALPLVAAGLAGLAEGLSQAIAGWEFLPPPIQASILVLTAVVTLGPVVVAVLARITAGIIAARVATIGFTAALLANPIALAAVAAAGVIGVVVYRQLSEAADDVTLSQEDLNKAVGDISTSMTRVEIEGRLFRLLQRRNAMNRIFTDGLEEVDRGQAELNEEIAIYQAALENVAEAERVQAEAQTRAADTARNLRQSLDEVERAARDMTATGIATAFALALMAGAADDAADGVFDLERRLEAAIGGIRAAFEDELQLRGIVEALFNLADPTRALRDELEGVADAEEKVGEEADDAQDKIRALARAMERARASAASLLTDFSNLIVSGLRRQATGSLEAQRAVIEAQRMMLEGASDERLRILERERDAAIGFIDDQLAARVEALNAELALLDAADFEAELGRINRAIALAFDPRERARLEEDRARLLRRVRRDEIRDAISVEEESAERRRVAIEAEFEARRQAEENAVRAALDALRRQEQAAEDTFSNITNEFELASRARELILAGEFDELARLLDEFVPEWRTFGLSAGEAMLDGLQPSIDEIVRRIRAALGGFGGGGGFAGGGGGGAGPTNQNVSDHLANIQMLIEGGAPESAINAVRRIFESTFGFPSPLAMGGLITRPTIGLIGERGPEIVSPVNTLRDLLQEVGAGGVGDVRVFIGDVELRSMIRVEVDGQTTRQLTRGARLAGA